MSPLHPESSAEWRLPEDARPPLLGELVERIDEALATARASEAAIMTVGAAALDAAEQARRAAELAERASIAMNSSEPEVVLAAVPAALPVSGDDGLRAFSARADRVAARLRRLEPPHVTEPALA